jgi:hypothetical protein
MRATEYTEYTEYIEEPLAGGGFYVRSAKLVTFSR